MVYRLWYTKSITHKTIFVNPFCKPLIYLVFDHFVYHFFTTKTICGTIKLEKGDIKTYVTLSYWHYEGFKIFNFN